MQDGQGTAVKITLVACGSRGDHQPFLPLALGLERAGHDVTVMCDEYYADSFESHGLVVDRYRMVEDWIPLMARWQNPDTAMDALAEMFDRTAAQAIPALVRAYERSDGVVLGGMLLTAAMQIRRRLRKRTVVAHWSPLAVFRGDSSYTAIDPGCSLRNARGYAAYLGMMLPSLVPPARAAAEYLGMGWHGRRSLLAVLGQSASVDQFFGVSPLVAPAFAGHRRTPATGFLRLADPGPDAPGLDEFLDAGPAPVFLGLGSATDGAMRERFASLVGAAVDAGQRVVTMRASGLTDADFPADRVCLTSETPYDSLFLRCSLIVHHGGSGTTASALAAGVPQFVTPLVTDQPYFGRRMFELGTGVRPVPFPEVDPEDLLAAIAEAPGLAPRAAELGRQERATDGVGNAVRFLERKFKARVRA